MSIWIYEDTYPAPNEPDVTRETCLFCESKVECVSISSDRVHQGEIRVCRFCGWWCRNERNRIPDFDGFEDSLSLRYYYSMDGACAQLRNLDLSDINIPLNDIHSFIVADYEKRFDIHPRKLEELVASVFRNQGYIADVTAYQNDGGIDVILSKSNETIGVQVKRYKNKIEVEQIRSLAGALILSGHTSGMFVTTSAFRSGVVTASEQFNAKGFPIELVDAHRFYDALKIERMELREEDLEEFVSEIQGIGESQVIYEKEGPF